MIELQDIARQLRSSVQIKVFFIQPASKDRGWVESSSWALAKMIPEAEVITDPYGSVARMFNAQVSGEAVLYSADGELLFSGGITPSRGHIGENRGAKSIIEAVRLGKTTTQRTPTYGCALFNNMERGTIAWK